jgi:hypothetical protein
MKIKIFCHCSLFPLLVGISTPVYVSEMLPQVASYLCTPE